jgi:hypothetical protein
MLRFFKPRLLNPWAKSTSNPDKLNTTEEVKEVEDIEEGTEILLEEKLLDPKDIQEDTEHKHGNTVYFIRSGKLSDITIDDLYNTEIYNVKVDDITPKYTFYYRNEIMTKHEYQIFLKKREAAAIRNAKRVIFSKIPALNEISKKPALNETVYFVEAGHVVNSYPDENNKKIYKVRINRDIINDFRYFHGNQLMTEDEYNDKFVNINTGILKSTKVGFTKVGGSRRPRRNKSRSRRHKKLTRCRRKH